MTLHKRFQEPAQGGYATQALPTEEESMSAYATQALPKASYQVNTLHKRFQKPAIILLEHGKHVIEGFFDTAVLTKPL